ncbi:hypothetical protein ACIQ9P_26560 [Kitasatospora sp. NPDC094019]|uniref:hypothetical protein n=1 Tax=Kitasatospora sp. NPDC094019 TaxID=3364091 RepID=UPI0038005D1E
MQSTGLYLLATGAADVDDPADDRDARAAQWLRQGYCAVGYNEATAGLTDTTEDAVRAAFVDKGFSARAAAVCNRFVNLCRSGDRVIFRDATHVRLGTVGDYYRHPGDDVDRYRHRRSFSLLGSIPHTGDRRLKDATKSIGTFATVSKWRDELEQRFAFAVPDAAPATRRTPTPPGVPALRVKDDHDPAQRVPAAAPEATAAALNEHNATQNNLLALLEERGRTVLRPIGREIAFDLLVEDPGRLTVIEIKSVNDTNSADQLRHGLGQVLDYMDRLSADGRDISGVLWTSRKPTDAKRWRRLCTTHNVILGWPGEEERTFGV